MLYVDGLLVLSGGPACSVFSYSRCCRSLPCWSRLSLPKVSRRPWQLGPRFSSQGSSSAFPRLPHLPWWLVSQRSPLPPWLSVAHHFPLCTSSSRWLSWTAFVAGPFRSLSPFCLWCPQLVFPPSPVFSWFFLYPWLFLSSATMSCPLVGP